MTTRAVYLRASELQREYGTLYPFEIASHHAVDDPAVERPWRIASLARYRVPRSELFACDLLPKGNPRGAVSLPIYSRLPSRFIARRFSGVFAAKRDDLAAGNMRDAIDF